MHAIKCGVARTLSTSSLYAVLIVQLDAGESRFPTCRKWAKAFPHFPNFYGRKGIGRGYAMKTESALTVYSYSAKL